MLPRGVRVRSDGTGQPDRQRTLWWAQRRGLASERTMLQTGATRRQGLMAFGQSASARPIEGAVATMGVSDRVTFLRKTYAHLGASLIAFAVITAGIIKLAPETSLRFSSWALGGRL